MGELASRTPDGLLTAGAAARRLGVAPITIQRWVDDGTLKAHRSAGGHRRIHIREVRKRLATLQSDDDRTLASTWLDTLLTGDPAQTSRYLRRARWRHRSWAGVASEVSRAMVELGERWQSGRCAVFEEHFATETLRRAITASAAGYPSRRNARSALLTMVPGERHTIGLSLAELVLADHGWRCVWIGEGPPAAELPRMIATLTPDLCIVAARFDTKPRALRAIERRLPRAVAAGGGRLVLAGAARWAPAKRHHLCPTHADLERLLVQLHRRRP